MGPNYVAPNLGLKTLKVGEELRTCPKQTRLRTDSSEGSPWKTLLAPVPKPYDGQSRRLPPSLRLSLSRPCSLLPVPLCLALSPSGCQRLPAGVVNSPADKNHVTGPVNQTT